MWTGLLTKNNISCYLTHFDLRVDSSLTVGNVCEVMTEVEGDWKIVWGRGGIDISPEVLDPIIERHKVMSTAEKNLACAEVYVKYDPDASWTHLKSALTRRGEEKAAQKVTYS